MRFKSTSLLVLLFFMIVSCDENPNKPAETPSSPIENLATEKAAILNILNGETKAALTRDYESWKVHWIHEPFVTKTYLNLADNTSTETLGWEAINEFVKTYLEEHPEPAPLPDVLMDADVRLYGNGAWVSYEQNDPTRGRKRETRLMEKVAGQWKIAGMHTTIYGTRKNK